MRSWDLNTVDVEPHQPEVLHSEGEGRTIVVSLPAGEALADHQVHERSWLVVVSGRVELGSEDADAVDGGPGFLAILDPNERREVRAVQDTRLLMLLAPWPGQGHPSQRVA